MAWLLIIWSRRGHCICELSTGVRGRRVRRIVLAGERWCIAIIVSSKCVMIRWAISLSRISRQPWMVDGRPSVVVIVLSGIAMKRVVRLVYYTTGRNHRCNRDRMGWDSRCQGRLDCSILRLWSGRNSLLRLWSGYDSLLRLGSGYGCLLRLGRQYGCLLELSLRVGLGPFLTTCTGVRRPGFGP
jgi:hypothetical protein